MKNLFDRAWRAVADLSEIADWAGKLVDMKTGQTCLDSEIHYDDDDDEEGHEVVKDLEDGMMYYGDIQESILESYDWKNPERRLAAGAPPLTIAMSVAEDLSVLILLNLIRSIDALPDTCVWRDQTRHDLRMAFIETHPCGDGAFLLDDEMVEKMLREFLEGVIAFDDRFGMKLFGLCLLETDLLEDESRSSDRPDQEEDPARETRTITQAMILRRLRIHKDPTNEQVARARSTICTWVKRDDFPKCMTWSKVRQWILDNKHVDIGEP